MLSRTPRQDTNHKRKSSLLDLFGLGQLAKEPQVPEISAPLPNSLQQYHPSPQALQGEFIDLTLGAKRDSSHFRGECETPPKRRSYYDPNTDHLSPIQNVDAHGLVNETISLCNRASSRDYTHLTHSAQPSLSESLHDSESHCMSESQPQTPQTDYNDEFEHDDAAILQAECVAFHQPRFQTMNPASMHSVSTIGDACVRVGCSSPAFSDADPSKKRESMLSISTLDRTPSKRGNKSDLIDRYLNSLYDTQQETPAIDDDMDVDEDTTRVHYQPPVTPPQSAFDFPSRGSSLPQNTPRNELQSASSCYSSSNGSSAPKSVKVEDASFAMINPYANGSRSSSASVNVVPRSRVASSGGVHRRPVPSRQHVDSIMGDFENELARLDSIGTFSELPPPVSYPSSIMSNDKLTPHPALVTARNTAPGVNSRSGSQRDISRDMAGMTIASPTGPSNHATRAPHLGHSSTASVSTTETKSSKRHSLGSKFGKLKDFGRRITLSKPMDPPLGPQVSSNSTTSAPRPASNRSENNRRRSMLGLGLFGSAGEDKQHSSASQRRSTFSNSSYINVAPVINMRFESEKPDIGRGF
ncbi:hypothetical protein CJU90_5415 [Yarrowia sp. C11]|nr:hypothetical protein CJU90_5415 [Yarrowia sp. C11]KAG5364011.1 hypothetical protein CKK34_2794 [Yarrowia sp. E02]